MAPTGRLLVDDDWTDRTPAAGYCRSCRARVYWFRTARQQKLIPIDPGYVVVSVQRDGDRLITVLSGTTHFATCPDAALHRKKR